METYAKEAKKRWGHTKAYKESLVRVANMTKDDMAEIQRQSGLLMKEIAQNMQKGVRNLEVQALIDKHYNNLRNFYEPSIEIYRGLANMYVDDPRFKAYFEKYAKGLAKFMREAMYEYCSNH